MSAPARRGGPVPAAAVHRAHWRDYLALTKPRVVALIVLTAVVGTLLATPGIPPLQALVFGNLGIALAAALCGHHQSRARPANRCAHGAHPGPPAADRRA